MSERKLCAALLEGTAGARRWEMRRGVGIKGFWVLVSLYLIGLLIGITIGINFKAIQNYSKYSSCVNAYNTIEYVYIK